MDEHETDEVVSDKGVHPKIYNQARWKAQDFLEKLQAFVVIAGGSKRSINDLADMTVRQMLFDFIPNDITFGVMYRDRDREER